MPPLRRTIRSRILALSPTVRPAALPLIVFVITLARITVRYGAREVAFAPPYWDAVLGIFREAIWLADHGWNFAGLALGEPGYKLGGARTYLLSLYPSMVAGALSLFPSPNAAFAALRAVNLAAAVATIVVSTRVARVALGDARLASITGMLLALSPLFVSQALALNMEMLICLCVMLSVFSYTQQKLGRSYSLMTAAFLLKLQVVVAAAALAIAPFTRPASERSRRDRWYSMAMAAFVPLFIAYRFLEQRVWLMGGADGEPALSRLRSLHRIAAAFLWPLPLSGYLSQDIPDLYLLSLVGFVAAGTAIVRLRRSAEMPDRLLAVLALSVVSMHFALSLISVPLPRYLVLVLPEMIVGFIAMARMTLGMRGAIVAAATLAVFWGMNLNGDLYRAIRPDAGENGFILESTLEYQRHLAELRAEIDEVERECAQCRVVSSWPDAFVLSDDRFGYVRQPLCVESVVRSSPSIAAHCSGNETSVLATVPCNRFTHRAHRPERRTPGLRQRCSLS